MPWKRIGRIGLAVAAATAAGWISTFIDGVILRLLVAGILFSVTYVLIAVRASIVSVPEIRAILGRWLPPGLR